MPTATSQVNVRCLTDDQVATGNTRRSRSRTPTITANEMMAAMICVIKSGVVRNPLTTAATAAAISARFVDGFIKSLSVVEWSNGPAQ